MATKSEKKEVDGSWKTSIAKVKNHVTSCVNVCFQDGSYVRKNSQFRDWVTADGSSGFKAEAGRYHLYVSPACPWSQRTMIVRLLKGLDKVREQPNLHLSVEVIGMTIVDWVLAPGGWRFCDNKPLCSPDPLHGFHHLKQVYEHSQANYDGNITVPVLFDRKTDRIVNNESSEIIQMLSSAFNAFCPSQKQKDISLFEPALMKKMSEVDAWIYHQINNGVYRCGFAMSQAAYDKAVVEVFEGLDRVEAILATNRFLLGPQLTASDVRLWVTLIRFDHVYHTHFKCNKRRMCDYKNIFGYVKELYQIPAFRDSTSFLHIMHHYYESHRQINPTGIVAVGPSLDCFETPHNRKL